MFSIFGKRENRVVEQTFKSRVERFWNWYSQAASRIHQTIDARQSASLATEVSDEVDRLGPGFAWVFGPGKERGYSFTLSGEGVLHKQLLTQYWLSRAPNLDGWIFHSERQPGSIEGIQMKLGDQVFEAVEFWITLRVNDDSEKVDITVWHPLFGKMQRNNGMRPLFLFLDEVLGEFGTDQWIGEIELNDKQLHDAIRLNELSGFIAELQKTKGWKKYRPGDAITLYRFENPHMRFPRGDIVTLQTAQPALIGEYLNAEGKLKDPLAGTGADYIFISFDVGVLPQGKQVDARAAIEDALDSALRAECRGRLLGGGFGKKFACIDLLVYDGLDSIQTVERLLKDHKLPAGTAINFFAEEKRQRRVVL